MSYPSTHTFGCTDGVAEIVGMAHVIAARLGVSADQVIAGVQAIMNGNDVAEAMRGVE